MRSMTMSIPEPMEKFRRITGVWWGYEDEKLFANAKKRLTELAESGAAI